MKLSPNMRQLDVIAYKGDFQDANEDQIKGLLEAAVKEQFEKLGIPDYDIRISVGRRNIRSITCMPAEETVNGKKIHTETLVRSIYNHVSGELKEV